MNQKKDYSATVNLPKTTFPMKANLPSKEKEIIDFWMKNKIYENVLNKNSGNQKFILHDGPPYANGSIHIGHALNKILKDIIIKYKLMKGMYAPFICGWDCHGLPIEYQLLKELKKNKKDINRNEFRIKAKNYALKYVELQKKDFIRLGVWANWEKTYLTLAPQYEAGIIRTFKELVYNGYIYRKKKPIYWCPECETALADAEVEYSEITSPSIYVKFKVIEFPEKLKKLEKLNNISVLVWTTTPWTLPANVAIAFHPETIYIIVEYTIKNETGHLIIAEKLKNSISSITKDIKIGNTITKIYGKEIEGMITANPLINRDSIGITADFVNIEDGTGVVHIAPGHGVEDYIAGLKYNLPLISPVDEQGRFTDEIKEFSGIKVFDADKLIINKMEEKNTIVVSSEIIHSYPHCWRCKNPVIFRATEQWFLNIEHNSLRQKLLEHIKNVRWVPHYGQVRISDMVSTRPDWCLSRQRYWGVPVPAVYCKKCNAYKLEPSIIEKFENFVKKEGSDCWFIRDVKDFIPDDLKCNNCGGTEFKKEEDILDVWFDSGTSYESVLLQDPDLQFPADMYLEGSDQHRGWFQTSLIPSVAVKDTSPFKTVLTHGFVVDGEGKKMSKSLGNIISPQEIVEKFGAEILRIWTSASDYSEDIKISKEIIDRLIEAYRKIRNTIRFLLGNLYDFNENKNKIPYNELWEIDKFILHRLQKLIENVTSGYDEYKFHHVISTVNNFCIVELSNFYFDILKDRLYTYTDDGPQRRSAQTVLMEILITLTKLIAPVISFTAEETWQTLRKISGENKATSIFLEDFPVSNRKYFSEELEKKWLKIINIRDKVNCSIEQKRKEGVIGSSLEAKIKIIGNSELINFIKNAFPDKEKDTLESIFIVSSVEIEEKTNYSEPQIEVTHADGIKCERCWNWSVLTDSEGLCPRCKKVLNVKK